MNKNCDNCYWKGFEDKFCIYEYNKPNENICKRHEYVCNECDSDDAKYKYNEKYYCLDCLLKEFDVKEYSITHYVIDGEYLGSEDNIGEVVFNLDSKIEEIE